VKVLNREPSDASRTLEEHGEPTVEIGMTTFHVSYYKILQNSAGHSFKCLQRTIDVDAANPIAALTSIEKNGLAFADCDCLEVTTLAEADEMATVADRASHAYEESLG
jgi:hypothetical protein